MLQSFAMSLEHHECFGTATVEKIKYGYLLQAFCPTLTDDIYRSYLVDEAGERFLIGVMEPDGSVMRTQKNVLGELGMTFVGAMLLPSKRKDGGGGGVPEPPSWLLRDEYQPLSLTVDEQINQTIIAHREIHVENGAVICPFDKDLPFLLHFAAVLGSVREWRGHPAFVIDRSRLEKKSKGT